MKTIRTLITFIIFFAPTMIALYIRDPKPILLTLWGLLGAFAMGITYELNKRD